jgi:transposase
LQGATSVRGFGYRGEPDVRRNVATRCARKPYAWACRLLQTIPGIDEISAALILIEIGDDLLRFGSPSACHPAIALVMRALSVGSVEAS